jgi:antitoxin HicB
MQSLKAKDRLKIIKDEIEYQFEVDEAGGYIVSVPELAGCVSEGDTFEDAWAMVQDAMEGWLQVAAKHRDPIPQNFQGLVSNNQLGPRG